MSTPQPSAAAGPSTVSAQETTPLLASSGESRAPTNESTGTGEDGNETTNPGEGVGGGNARRGHPILTGVTKTIYRFFFTATIVGTCQLVSAAVLWGLTVYGSNQFGERDYPVDRTFGVVVLASLVGFLVSIVNLFSYRRSGQPISLFVNIIVFAFATWFVVLGALSPITEKLDGFGSPDCDEMYRPYPGSHDQCVRWLVAYSVFVWIYLLLSLMLGFDFLALFVNFFIKLYRERSQSPSSSSWSLPAGYVSFEVNVRWGAPRAQDESQGGAAASQSPRDEESGGNAQ